MLRYELSPVLVVLLFAVACGGETGERPGPIGMGGLAEHMAAVGHGAAESIMTPGSECETDEPYECAVYMELANGTVSCFRGVQHCDAGIWGPCE